MTQKFVVWLCELKNYNYIYGNFIVTSVRYVIGGHVSFSSIFIKFKVTQPEWLMTVEFCIAIQVFSSITEQLLIVLLACHETLTFYAKQTFIINFLRSFSLILFLFLFINSSRLLFSSSMWKNSHWLSVCWVY